MKRAFTSVFLALLLSFQAGWSEQLQASVSKRWTVDMARQEAFREAKPFVDVSQYPSIDPNLMENLAVRNKGGGEVGERIITVYSGGKYSVTELGGKTAEGRYYLNNGKLYAIEFFIVGPDIIKGYQHSTEDIPGVCRRGQLVRISLSNTEGGGAFVFKTDGTLSAHWLGNNCYNVDGSSCGTRKTFSY